MRTDSVQKSEIKSSNIKDKKTGKGEEFRSVLKNETDSDKKTSLVRLGSLSKNQTVSDLLIKNSTLKKDTWSIIHSDVNSQKPFNRIMMGTEIFINPDTKEILWGDKAEKSKISIDEIKTIAKKVIPESKPADSDPKISKAVESYMGKDYKAMDCFELLVNGLKNMGVQYYGKGGLREKLIGMASKEGKPKYSYLNGEGIIKASGQEVFNKSFVGISRNYKKQAEKIYNEIKPYLSQDQILSFSTNSSGHTGIISKNNQDWTYINSGELDNSIKSETKIKGVGEEKLKNEFVNWFRRAYNKKEGLTITLGKLNQMKLAAYGAGMNLKA